MDVTVEVPQAPVRLTPGVPTLVPVELHNRSAVAASVRVVVARGRASDWVRSEPPTVHLPPGGAGTLELLVQPPAEVPPTGALTPFTVRALDAANDVPAGWATGLLRVAAPDRLTGDLVAVPGHAGAFELRLHNASREPATVAISARLDGLAGSVAVQPDTVELLPGAAVTVTARARPRPALVGASATYAVTVTVRDAAAGSDAPPLLSATGTARRQPQLAPRTAAVLGTILLLLATGAIALIGGKLPLPGRAGPAPTAAASAQPPVRRPFVLVQVFPRQGAGARETAEAAHRRLAAAGMQLRLVDSLTSDELADDAGGFWVLLQDGFATEAEALAFCDRYRPVAPECRLAP